MVPKWRHSPQPLATAAVDQCKTGYSIGGDKEPVCIERLAWWRIGDTVDGTASPAFGGAEAPR